MVKRGPSRHGRHRIIFDLQMQAEGSRFTPTPIMPQRKEKPLLSFVTDTREQLPLKFFTPRKDRFDDGGTVEYCLESGDYSCEKDGVLLPIRIERKSHSDYVGVVGRNRDRFAGAANRADGMYQSGPTEWRKSELERLREFKSYLIIEATAAEVLHGCERSQVPGKAALHSALAWSITYGIHVIFAGDRTHARQIAQFLLEEFAYHYS